MTGIFFWISNLWICGFDLWISGALLTIGAEAMAAPADQQGCEPGARAVRTACAIERFIGTLLQFCFVLSVGFVWYGASFWAAAVFVSSAVPGRMISDVIRLYLRRPPTSGAAAAIIVAACLLLGPAIAGLGAYRLAGELAKISRTAPPAARHATRVFYQSEPNSSDSFSSTIMNAAAIFKLPTVPSMHQVSK